VSKSLIPFILAAASFLLSHGYRAALPNPSFAASFIQLGWALVTVAFGILLTESLRKPLLEIFIPDPPDRAGEDNLEWVHFGVRSVKRKLLLTETARRVEVEIIVSGIAHTMRWQAVSRDSPPQYRDIPCGKEALVPFAIRSFRDGEVRYGVHLDKNICYLTDERFLILSQGDYRLPPDMEHNVDIIIRREGQGIHEFSLRFDCARLGKGQMRLVSSLK